MPSDGSHGAPELERLAAIIDRQRRELEQARAGAAARSVVDLARGALIERLGCTPAEAASQLTTLAHEAGTPVAEIAAAIISRDGTVPTGTVPTEDEETGTPPDAVLRTRVAEVAAEQAADGAEFAAAVLDQALAPLGAAAVALWLISADGSLDLLGEAGLGPAEASRWRRIPPQMDCLEQRVAAGTPDLWLPDGPDGAAQDGPGHLPLAGPWAGGSRAVIALPDRAGALLGVMEVCWPGPRDGFPDPLRQQVGDLARACAQVLSVRVAEGELAPARSGPALHGLLDGLLETVLVASAVRDGTGTVTDFRIDHASSPADLPGRTLAEAYPMTAVAGGVLDRATRALLTGQAQYLPGPLTAAAADQAPGAITDARIARFFDGVVITWRIASQADQLTTVLGQIQRLGRIGAWTENLLTGRADWTAAAFGLFGLPAREGTAIPLGDLHSYVTGPDVAAVREFRDTLLRTGRPASATFRIVRPDDGSVRQIRVFAEPVLSPAGTADSVRGAFQDITAEYQTRVVLAATQDQLADSEHRAEEEHLLAVRLQRAILPPTAHPVEAAGIEVAVRYRPAGPGHLVGGDWYDTQLLPSKEVLLVVGDIAGHGIDAVTGMVAARNCLRGLAVTGAGPGALLAHLNSAICHLIDGVVGTVVCGLYEPGERMLRWARAGHLPPVVIRDGQATTLPLPHGVLLGSDPDAQYEEFSTPLAPGDTMLLFTDGMIERRDTPITDALEQFAQRAAQPFQSMAFQTLAQPSAARLADHVLAHAASDTGDDACLVAVRIR
ncbi:MAG TPA: SpoIIE family protein phosphatase [Streptosporangiaceae bacterium]|nr:SpoIIE family protein phosphatase [Streptosporangiaceae bacterium]